MLGLPQPRSCAIGHFYKARPCPSPPPPTSAGGCSSCESSIALSADQPPPSGEGDLLLARPLRRSTARRSMKRMSVEDRPPRDLMKPQPEPRPLCFPCSTPINICMPGHAGPSTRMGAREGATRSSPLDARPSCSTLQHPAVSGLDCAPFHGRVVLHLRSGMTGTTSPFLSMIKSMWNLAFIIFVKVSALGVVREGLVARGDVLHVIAHRRRG